MPRLIFHIDVNSAFLSWEAVRRLQNGDSLDLRTIPSAVGGDRASRRGVILAKSIPAKKFGVVTGEPITQALAKCPNLVIVPSDGKLYKKCSSAFVAICREIAPVVERFSIDECFLDMSRTERIYPDPVKIANDLRERIKNELGFTVNIGIGENKLCAKMASDFEKPDRVHTLFPDEIAEKLHPLPVRELLWVGRSTADRLARAGIRTIGQLAAVDLETLRSLVGDKAAASLHRHANGIDNSPVTAEAEDAKGYSISTTLAADVVSAPEAYRVLHALADSVTSRMRRDGFMATCISVQIRSSSFKNRSHQRKITATDITREVYRTAVELFDELWDRRTPLRLLGIALTDLTRERMVQLSLFEDESSEQKRERERRLDKTVDDLRARFGSDMIKFLK